MLFRSTVEPITGMCVCVCVCLYVVCVLCVCVCMCVYVCLCVCVCVLFEHEAYLPDALALIDQTRAFTTPERPPPETTLPPEEGWGGEKNISKALGGTIYCLKVIFTV